MNSITREEFAAGLEKQKAGATAKAIEEDLKEEKRKAGRPKKQQHEPFRLETNQGGHSARIEMEKAETPEKSSPAALLPKATDEWYADATVINIVGPVGRIVKIVEALGLDPREETAEVHIVL